jgi:integrase
MKLIQKIRKDFPPVRKYKTQNQFVYIVDCRSKKYGMTTRFKRESENSAIQLHNQIKSTIVSFGVKSSQCNSILSEINIKKISDQIAPFGVDIETAVNHFIKSRGNEIQTSIKPSVSEMVEEFEKYKICNILEPISNKTKREVKHYSSVIKRIWGHLRVDEINHCLVKDYLSSLKVQNSTRRKYKIYISMFFKWVINIKNIEIKNPVSKITIKVQKKEIKTYTPLEIIKMFNLIKDSHPEMLGWFGLNTFVGCRPSETIKMKWDDINFKNGELYIQPDSKTGSRRPLLDAEVLEWFKNLRDLNQSKELIPKNIDKRERFLRKEIKNKLGIHWIQDGLRHTSVTYYYAKHKSWDKIEFNYGHSYRISRSNYQRSVPIEEVNEFWDILKLKF